MKKIILLFIVNLTLTCTATAQTLQQVTIHVFNRTEQIDSPILVLLLSIAAICYGIANGAREQLAGKTWFVLCLLGVLFVISLFFHHFAWGAEFGIFVYNCIALILAISSSGESKEKMATSPSIHNVTDRAVAYNKKTLFVIARIAPVVFILGTYATFYLCCDNLFVPTMIFAVFLISLIGTYVLKNRKELLSTLHERLSRATGW